MALMLYWANPAGVFSVGFVERGWEGGNWIFEGDFHDLTV